MDRFDASPYALSPAREMEPGELAGNPNRGETRGQPASGGNGPPPLMSQTKPKKERTMTKTLQVENFRFDRDQIMNLGDAVAELIFDRFGDIAQEMAMNAVGEKLEDEDEDDYEDRVNEATSNALFLITRAATNDIDEFETL